MKRKGFIKLHVSKAFLFYLCIILLVCQMFTANTAEITYEGGGTLNDPYLVKTAAQLDGMRKKLDACYKLAANIDLSGYASEDPTPKKNYAGGFVPIGNLATPFKGTFTCDIGADGQPLYEIKNLKITNNAGTIYGHMLKKNKYSDYSKYSSFWEAALFGATEGASISNILVTEAEIKNTVIGQNQMNGDWSINPGQDEMATSVLIGIANSSKVSGCVVSGKVISSTNYTGGIIGSANKTTVSGCAAYISVNSTGLWCNGGFIGGAKDVTLKECYLKADSLDIDTSASGAFIGSVYGTVENSYATGTVKSGNTFIGRFSGDVFLGVYGASRAIVVFE